MQTPSKAWLVLVAALTAACADPLAARTPQATADTADSGGDAVFSPFDAAPAPTSKGPLGAHAMSSAAAWNPAELRPDGVWYLAIGDQRLALTIAGAKGKPSSLLGSTPGAWNGTVLDEAAGTSVPTDAIAWNPGSQQLNLSYAGPQGEVDVAATVTAGVLVGRARFAWDPAAPGPAQYPHHVTGWNAQVLEHGNPQSAFEVRIGGDRLARLRIGRAPDGQGMVGTLKVYASGLMGALGEEPQRDIDVQQWDGTHLNFSVQDDDGTWTYSGFATGRAIGGTATGPDGSAALIWTGQRAEVLSYGLEPKPAAARTAWQNLARARLARLLMAGNPAPLKTNVTVLQADVDPTPPTRLPGRAAPSSLPQAYRLTELQFDSDLADPLGGAAMTRRAHAWLARPTTPTPVGGFPVVLALNGHYGSAAAVMNPATGYFYGDAFARRGYVVLALDVGHRPIEDRSDIYTDLTDGDDAASANGPHPAIHADGADTDWEEDGERVWDGMRALDFLTAQPDVDAKRLVVTGLSMGGEVATLLAALDARVAMTVVAGFSPDLGVMLYHGNHPCWLWRHADIREYVDASDLFALIAPRGLLVETGSADGTFSAFTPPFAADKQVLRRARVAFADAADHFTHDLHPGGHTWDSGENAVPPGITTPLLTAPDAAGAVDWQLDAQTTTLPMTVFDLVVALGG